MTRNHFVWLGSLLLVLVAAPAAAQQTSIAYVNTQRIMAESPETAQAQAAFNQEVEQRRLALEQMETRLDSLQQELQREPSGPMSQQAQEERQQQIQEQLQELFVRYQQERATSEQAVQQRRAELLEPIMERIYNVLQQMREEGGYAMIFDAAAPTMLVADPALDLTDQALERLRQSGG